MINLATPFNFMGFLLNVKFNDVIISGTHTTTTLKVMEYWYLAKIHSANNVTLQTMLLI